MQRIGVCSHYSTPEAYNIIYIYIKQKCLSVCLSVTFGGGCGVGGGKGGQEEGGSGEGVFQRWNAWVEILFPSNAGSPS